MSVTATDLSTLKELEKLRDVWGDRAAFLERVARESPDGLLADLNYAQCHVLRDCVHELYYAIKTLEAK